MGRGRQKAKQTKVARQLKYFSPQTDYRALEQELTSGSGHHEPSAGHLSTHQDSDDEDDELGSHDD